MFLSMKRVVDRPWTAVGLWCAAYVATLGTAVGAIWFGGSAVVGQLIAEIDPLLAARPPAQQVSTRPEIKTYGSMTPTSDWLERLQNGSMFRGGGRSSDSWWGGRSNLGGDVPQRPAEAPRVDPRLPKNESPSVWSSGRNANIGSRTVCVRLCDGYFWPISNSTTSLDADEATCEKSCGVPTRLFIHSGEDDTLEGMADRNGEPYTKLKNAFVYRTKYVNSCRCKPQPWEAEARNRHLLYALESKAERGDRVATSKLKSINAEVEKEYKATVDRKAAEVSDAQSKVKQLRDQANGLRGEERRAKRGEIEVARERLQTLRTELSNLKGDKDTITAQIMARHGIVDRVKNTPKAMSQPIRSATLGPVTDVPARITTLTPNVETTPGAFRLAIAKPGAANAVVKREPIERQRRQPTVALIAPKPQDEAPSSESPQAETPQHRISAAVVVRAAAGADDLGALGDSIAAIPVDPEVYENLANMPQLQLEPDLADDAEAVQEAPRRASKSKRSRSSARRDHRAERRESRRARDNYLAWQQGRHGYTLGGRDSWE